MSWDCGIDGTAVVQRNDDGSITWLHADELIHVSRELVDSRDELSALTAKYDIGFWCEVAHAYHARRRDA